MCEAYSSFEGVSSSQIIGAANICLSQHRNSKQTVKALQYDFSLLI